MKKLYALRIVSCPHQPEYDDQFVYLTPTKQIGTLWQCKAKEQELASTYPSTSYHIYQLVDFKETK